MARCRIDFIALLLTILSAGSANATVPSPQVKDAVPVIRTELAEGNDRQEAAEERAETAFRIRKENALHRYRSALKKCRGQGLPPQSQCVDHAHSRYEESIDEADAAFQESHARALMLGTTSQ
jgi:hypothetical protein